VAPGNAACAHLLTGNRASVAIPAGTLVTYDMVEEPADSMLWELRRLQDRDLPDLIAAIPRETSENRKENKMLAILAWLTVIVFMALILTKKMHPFTAIVLIPVIFAVIGALLGLYAAPTARTLKMPLEAVTLWDQIGVLGVWIKLGLTRTSGTAFMLFFAIMFFSLMLNVGLFDPLARRMVHLAKGDPVKVLVATSVLATIVSMSGDGTTTTLICCTALIPVYRKLNLKMMHLGVLLILQNTILNLLPWSGPTARVIAVIDGIDVQRAAEWVAARHDPVQPLRHWRRICPRARRTPAARRAASVEHADIDAIFAETTVEQDALKRPQHTLVNSLLTFAALALLISGTFRACVHLSGRHGACAGVNYKTLSEQKDRLYANSGEVLATVIMVIGAGVFMGLFTNSGMSDALAGSLVNVVPAADRAASGG
jgi:CitMHS family citrate-Mg2+:H+ or citrate-Ca2+:H+ symporter